MMKSLFLASREREGVKADVSVDDGVYEQIMTQSEVPCQCGSGTGTPLATPQKLSAAILPVPSAAMVFANMRNPGELIGIFTQLAAP